MLGGRPRQAGRLSGFAPGSLGISWGRAFLKYLKVKTTEAGHLLVTISSYAVAWSIRVFIGDKTEAAHFTEASNEGREGMLRGGENFEPLKG